ncbi:MAG: DegV family protein [Candidatus Pacebacteria bacterium]|nr:DegV family protein [Candidatus Paceibacterota bacterium]
MNIDNKNKKPIGIVADEAVDLEENLINEHDITLVRFKIDYGEMADLPGNVYEKARQGEGRGLTTTIKTSQPSINDFLTAFKKKLEEFESIICLTISGKLSGTFNSAVQAIKFLPAEQQPKVSVVDTLIGSSGQGLMALWVAEKIKEGSLTAEKIKENLEKIANNFKLLGAYEQLKWIEASGRLPRLIPAAIRQAEKMKFRPIFTIRNGKLTFGSIRKITNGLADLLFQEFEKQTQGIRNSGQKIRAAISHADNPEQAQLLKNLVNSAQRAEVVSVALASFPIGAHIGPGSLILCWQQ